MRGSRVASTALIAVAVTVLSPATSWAQSPGQGGTPPAPPPASSTPAPAAKPSEGPAGGAKAETGGAAKPAEAAPSAGAASPGTPPDGDSQSATFAALLQEGFELRATSFVPADAVSRQSGKDSSDAIVVTLQKGAASAVCFYTLKAYVSRKLGTIPACTVHR